MSANKRPDMHESAPMLAPPPKEPWFPPDKFGNLVRFNRPILDQCATLFSLNLFNNTSTSKPATLCPQITSASICDSRASRMDNNPRSSACAERTIDFVRLATLFVLFSFATCCSQPDGQLPPESLRTSEKCLAFFSHSHGISVTFARQSVPTSTRTSCKYTTDAEQISFAFVL